MSRLLTFIIAATLATTCHGEPFGLRIASELVDGAFDAIDVIGDGLDNITDITSDGVVDAQKEINTFVEERVDTSVREMTDLNEAVVDIVKETVDGMRDTANAFDGYWDDSVKDAGILKRIEKLSMSPMILHRYLIFLLSH